MFVFYFLYSADDEDDTHIHSHLRYEAMRDKGKRYVHIFTISQNC